MFLPTTENPGFQEETGLEEHFHPGFGVFAFKAGVLGVGNHRYLCNMLLTITKTEL
jgi:hypothetical protein